MKKIILLTLILLLLPLVSAFEIYTEPEQINFNNVLINGLVEKRVKVFTDSSENIDVSLTASGPFENWITIEPFSTVTNADTPAEFQIKINPQETRLGTYQGMIIVNALYNGNQLTSAVTSATNLDFSLTLTDKEIIQAKVTDIIVKNVETSQPVNINLYLLNNGNKEINPSFEINLYDENQQNLLKSTSKNVAVIPSADEKVISFTFDNDLPIGNYKIVSKILFNDYLLGQQTVPFKIVEPDTLPPESETINTHLEAIPLSSTSTVILVTIILAIAVYYAVKRKNELSKPKKRKKK